MNSGGAKTFKRYTVSNFIQIIEEQVIMTKKTPIKVIKRDERNRLETSAESAEIKKTPQETAREMVSTVSNWVNEFQQKRRTETKQALKSLFPEPPQPSRI